jgi:hypothetical protein
MRIWSKTLPYNCDTGIEFYGTDGMLFVSKRGKMQLWDNSNRLVADPKPKETVVVAKNHQVDFLNAIAEGAKPAADIAIGHDSAALIHLANIAVRINRVLHLDPTKEIISGDDEAQAMLSRTYRESGHWAIPKSV